MNGRAEYIVERLRQGGENETLHTLRAVAADEIEHLHRVIQWCRMRLKEPAYRLALDDLLANPQKLDTERMDWQRIETAPKDGRLIELGWLPNGKLEFAVRSRWKSGEWDGHYTPTHWRAMTQPHLKTLERERILAGEA